MMAAADLHSQGRLVEPQRIMPSGGVSQPNPSKPHKGRKLRVVA
jgi:hypothetical protein